MKLVKNQNNVEPDAPVLMILDNAPSHILDEAKETGGPLGIRLYGDWLYLVFTDKNRCGVFFHLTSFQKTPWIDPMFRMSGISGWTGSWGPGSEKVPKKDLLDTLLTMLLLRWIALKKPWNCTLCNVSWIGCNILCRWLFSSCVFFTYSSKKSHPLENFALGDFEEICTKFSDKTLAKYFLREREDSAREDTARGNNAARR